MQKTYINIKQEGAKQIWESIQKYMPIFSLFQSDRKNQDKDSEIQDPMKAAIKEVLNKDNILETLNNVFKVSKILSLFKSLSKPHENTLSQLGF